MSRTDEAEEWISELECRIVEIATIEQNTEKRMGEINEHSLRNLWDNIKGTNICIKGIQEEEEREKRDPRKYLKR